MLKKLKRGNSFGGEQFRSKQLWNRNSNSKATQSKAKQCKGKRSVKWWEGECLKKELLNFLAKEVRDKRDYASRITRISWEHPDWYWLECIQTCWCCDTIIHSIKYSKPKATPTPTLKLTSTPKCSDLFFCFLQAMTSYLYDVLLFNAMIHLIKQLPSFFINTQLIQYTQYMISSMMWMTFIARFMIETIINTLITY